MPKAYQEYQNRVNFKGSDTKSYVKTVVRESIDDLINNSQYGFTVSVDKIARKIAILTTKTTQEYDCVNVVAQSGFLNKGTIFTLENEDWIILQQMFRPDQPGFNGTAYKCTGDISWVDEDENLFTQPAYIRKNGGSNSLVVTPESEQSYANLVLHDTDWTLMAATPLNLNLHPDMRFIIKGQAYRITNVDNISIDGVSIISFADDKLLDSDDIINGVAHTTIYKLEASMDLPIQIAVGGTLELPIYILKNGEEVADELICISTYEEIASIVNGVITGVSVGETDITCTLLKNPMVTFILPIEVVAEPVINTEVVVIVGSDTIVWDTQEAYELSNGDLATFIVTAPSKVTYETETTDTSVSISIGDKYAGIILIKATDSNGVIYSKQVNIKTA